MLDSPRVGYRISELGPRCFRSAATFCLRRALADLLWQVQALPQRQAGRRAVINGLGAR